MLDSNLKKFLAHADTKTTKNPNSMGTVWNTALLKHDLRKCRGGNAGD